MTAFLIICAFLASPASALRAQDAASNDLAANPIRKVVTMLQAMQKKVSEEGEKEKQLFDNFHCYCQTGGATLGDSIARTEAKAPALSSDIEQAEEKRAQWQQDLKQHQLDLDDAKAALHAAVELREREAAAYAKEKAEADANIAAVNQAVAALKKGMAVGFLQTGDAQVLRQLALSKQDMLEGDRQEILAFLSGAQGSAYAPQSGEITGILKGLGDDMSSSLAEATAAERAAVECFEKLTTAKNKEVTSLTASIETKTQRSGELAVSIVQMKNDLSTTQAQLLEDKQFLADLDANCASKAKDYDERVRTRSEELAAIAETIRVLNDDDTLELLKQTLPSAASASLVQVSKGEARRATAARKELQRRCQHNPRFDFIVLALTGNKISFEKVIKMVDDMIRTLKAEQVDDSEKQKYCAAQFDAVDDKKKTLARAASNSDSAIANAEASIDAVKEELTALEDGLRALDTSVAEATAQRQKEHAEFTSLMASDSAAKDLLRFATNRLKKFYNKALYKPSPKRELSEEDRVVVNMGGTASPTDAPGGIAGTGVAVLAQLRKDAPPPPPETFGAYAKKSGEATGVIAMIDLLIKDLDKEMIEAQAQEKDSQAEYEETMRDSAAKRVQDMKAVTQKTSTKSEVEMELQEHKEAKGSTAKELLATQEYISALHAECDWLLQYFDMRKEARTAEIESLHQASSILSGADFSL